MHQPNSTTAACTTDQLQTLKTWIAPVVSESPVNEITQASFTVTSGPDLGLYS